MATDAQLLDFDGITVRSDSFVFDLVDAAGYNIGTVTPEQPVRVENNVAQGVKRRLTNLRLSPSDTAAVNVLTDRMQPSMILSNGSSYPLGTFLFADAVDRRMQYGVQREASMGDLGVILAQPLPTALSIAAGTLCTTAITTVATNFGLTSILLDTSTSTIGAPLTFPGGETQTTGITVLTQLCGIAGFLAPYFTAAGVLRGRTTPVLSTAVATLTYASGGRIIADSIVESNDVLSAPNRYLVVDGAATTTEISGEYTLPASYPNSYARRGFYITSRSNSPGIGSVVAATAAATTLALTDPKAYETVQFASPLDPRHETFDVVSYLGQTYMELGWGMDLFSGGHMSHTLKRIYLT